MADRIELRGLRFYGFHGVLAEEKQIGQQFEVDIICWIDPPAADRVEFTVNYAELAELAEQVVTGPARDLIETVAGEIASTAMERYGLLHAIEVTIHKPRAPIPHPFTDVAVVARRSRKKH